MDEHLKKHHVWRMKLYSRLPPPCVRYLQVDTRMFMFCLKSAQEKKPKNSLKPRAVMCGFSDGGLHDDAFIRSVFPSARIVYNPGIRQYWKSIRLYRRLQKLRVYNKIDKDCKTCMMDLLLEQIGHEI